MLGQRSGTIKSAVNRSMRYSNTTPDVKDVFGKNAFDVMKAEEIPEHIRHKLREIARSKSPIPRDLADVVATAVTQWAVGRGCSHFCHWFQPLTGSSAEKHDSLLSIDHGEVIEKISVSALLQGEPDASSFPHGGSRSTFEARGYTIWDLTSPMFIVEGPNGKTLCIPSAFVSYSGEALDTKTPLLRSISRLCEQAKTFVSLLEPDGMMEQVHVTAGCEQEYFLVDKEFYYNRPDLVMTGRTLLGAPAPKNQQLDDHYFGRIPSRVIAFMQELDIELYKLGIASKTRHNEVAPGQYEVAAIFDEANRSCDQNQLVMAMIKEVASRHSFVALLHEKPFTGINGNGKHINWSLATDSGRNLLNPGIHPAQNKTFLALMAVVVEAVRRHAATLRMSVASAGNDHRLGENEAPPAIISVYLGSALADIFETLRQGRELVDLGAEMVMEPGANQLAQWTRDSTDRNRTSPFAFTGDKFEFRAVGATMNVAIPITMLNTAVADVLAEANVSLQQLLDEGTRREDAVNQLLRQLTKRSDQVLFDGDGYSDEWLAEAERRGLPHLVSTPQALGILKDPETTEFLTRMSVLSAEELAMRYNVLLERYNILRLIEFQTLIDMVNQTVLPTGFEYQAQLLSAMDMAQRHGKSVRPQQEIADKVASSLTDLYDACTRLSGILADIGGSSEETASVITEKALPLSKEIAARCTRVEAIVPDISWTLPKYREMLFLR